MPNPSEATVRAGVVREAIDIRRLPWIRPLVADYAERYASVATLFAGNPADPTAWRETIARVQRAPRDRPLVASVVAAQLEERDAPAAARAAAGLLSDAATVAILTGQQAGLFGGPLYSLLKAITAIQLARDVHATYGVPVVPVFWVEAEDHDWDEIRSATVLDREFGVAEIQIDDLPGAGTQPVGSLELDTSIEQTITALADTLAPTEFTTDVIAALRRRYHPGARLGAAFAGWMDELAGRHGLVVFDASDPRGKPAAADIFADELRTPLRTSHLVRAAGAAMKALGHAPQVDPADDAVHLFYLDAAGRLPIRRRNGECLIGDAQRASEDVAAEAAAHPERFSPNVVLRPLVQDRLFPTVCYVAGPAELAYQAQLGGVYKAFAIEPPLLYSRASVTMLDGACGRFFDRADVPFEALQARDDSVLNRLLERQLPPSIERTLEETEQHVVDRAGVLRDAVAEIDPTLAGAVDTTVERVRETLKTLQNKIVQASKRKDDTLRRQFARARALTFPGGEPQERVLSIAFFVNRYGLGLSDRLIDVLPPETHRHYLLML